MNIAKRDDIQILRGFAVAIVIAFHSRSSLLPNGYLGVDIFFCISGFVLYPKLRLLFANPSKNNLNKFITSRWNRLVPAFIFLTSSNLLLLSIFASLNEMQSIYKQALLSSIFIGNLSASNLVGDYFHPNPNPFLHYWSLSCEWQIYFIFPILLVIISRRISFIRSVLFITALSMTFNFIDIFTSQIQYYLPFNRLWEFGVGIICNVVLNKLNISNSHRFILRILLVIALCFLFIIQINALLIAQILAVTVFCLFMCSGFVNENFFFSALKWLGDRSYSAYLLHYPLIYLAIYSPSSPNKIYFRMIGVTLALLITLCLSDISFKYIENRVTNSYFWKDRLRKYFSFFCFPLLCFTLISSNFLQTLDSNRVSVAWKVSKKCMGKTSLCLVSNNGEQNFVLLGDSHAMQYAEVFKELAKQYSLNFYMVNQNIENFAKSDLPFLVSPSKKLNCDVLFLSQYNHNRKNINDFISGLTKLKKYCKKTIYISDNPVFTDYLIYKHWINSSISSKFLEKEPVMRVSVKNLSIEPYRVGVLFKNRVKLLDMEVIDPFDFLCNVDFCFRKIGDDYLYYDDHHLTVFGASKMKRIFEYYIRPLT